MKQPLPTTLLAVTIGSYLLLGAFSLSPSDFGTIHDEGIYAVTAKSLAETGEYRIISLPGEPVQRKYPIVFPAILSMVWRIWPEFPGNILPMKAVSLMAGAVFLAFSYCLLRTVRDVSHRAAAVIVAICAFAPATCDLANSVMSELVYGAFSMTALWLLERALRHSASPWLGVASGGFAGCALLTRSVGMALVIAIIGGLAWRRNWRLLSMTALGLVLLVIPVKLWESPASDVDRAYEYYVGYGDWFRHAVADVGPRFFVWVPIKNLGYSFAGLSGTMLPARLGIFPTGALLNFVLLGLLIAGAFGVLLTIVGVSGRVCRRAPDVWALYLACYLIVLLIWPFPPAPRFFIPLLPLILVACRDGMARTGWFTSNPIRFLLAGVGVLTFLTTSGLSAVDRIGKAHVPTATTRYNWIIKNSKPDDVIACIDDPKCYLLTGHKSVLIAIPNMSPLYVPESGDVIRPGTMLEMLAASQAKLLMLEATREPNTLEQLARDALETLRTQHPDLLEELWRDDREPAVIYRVNAAPQK